MSEVLAFSAEHVCRLTGLTSRQLRYWDQTEFFSPEFREEARRSPFARVYSFRDVVGMRAIAEMRLTHQIPLQRLRRVGADLRRRFDQPWSLLTFYIVGKQVFYQEDRHAAIKRADRTGQQVMPFELTRVEGDMRRAIARLRTRAQDQIGRITQNRYVAENRPTLAGTRITTAAVWEFHAGGYSTQTILREYPQLKPADIAAVIAFEEKRLRPAG